MRVLVTGGAGYIGSHLVRALRAAGHAPVVYDSLVNGHRPAAGAAPLVVGDIHDRAALTAALREHRIGAVIHLAAFIEAGESVRLPEKYFHNNTLGGLAVLEAMRAAGVGRLVFSSTAAVYGQPERQPIRETDRTEPINPYGASKLCVELMLQGFARSTGVPPVTLNPSPLGRGAGVRGEGGETVVRVAGVSPARPADVPSAVLPSPSAGETPAARAPVRAATQTTPPLALPSPEGRGGMGAVALRYFNVAGADPSGEIGEDHDPETHLIPLILQVPLGKRAAVKIFGDDYPTPDGTCVRDYIHVCDLCAAHVLALDAIAPGEVKVYNLGNGAGFSVRQVIDACRQVTGHPIPADIAPRRPGDPPVLVASSEKAQAELGWRPQYPDIRTIVEHAWKWHSGHPEGYGEEL